MIFTLCQANKVIEKSCLTFQRNNFFSPPKFVALFLCGMLLTGCALTRVSKEVHEKEIQRLNLEGMTYAAALAKVRDAGFRCNQVETKPYQSKRVPGQLVKQEFCYKTSMELICPQNRRMGFEYSAAEGLVISVWSFGVVEKGCF